jgi:CheY-like chemotaxis protein
MNSSSKCVMLVDDNADDNFFHEREIRKSNTNYGVIAKNSGKDALEYLRLQTDPHPDLIFLDINMPGMDGWEFLKEFNQLDKEIQRGPVIIMLSTSDNRSDLEKIKAWGVISEYIIKPLTKEVMKEISDKYFK